MNNELWGGPLRVPYNELWEPKLIVRLKVCFLSAKWLTMNFSGGQLIVERPWRGVQNSLFIVGLLVVRLVLQYLPESEDIPILCGI